MQLRKKKDFEIKYPEKKEKEFKKVFVDWSRYEIDEDAILPHGKYAGQTLEQVMYEDDWYYHWMVKEQIIGAWGLIKLKGEPIIKKQAYFISSSGEKWITIYEIYPGNGISSPYL